MKLRLNMSHRVLAFLFRLPHQSYVSKIIQKILSGLLPVFVKDNIGFDHISREGLREHMRAFYNNVLGLPQESIVLILDGTYLFVEVIEMFVY